ncbi:hypothetical protein OEZ86_011301 [Tetradesmus obliquus]|uniref:Uncharacterized protein n=2 Tax=Tetradesmus obliquus TaxID=3088 RepID=A0ABY8TIA1_TETOB|nr:hypothetical protein OEZ85_008139 [Tetradesmus obliquus]WIA28768.1 hypothetical protein OEZ86_011301 [Tetradesmus obliquus]|eukprot:jgi/Sobl393_1/7/SZX74746.1
MSDREMGSNKTPNDPVKEQISQDKFGKSYDELTAHERIQVGGTKGGITQGKGNYTGHYQGEGSATEMKHTGDAAQQQE